MLRDHAYTTLPLAVRVAQHLLFVAFILVTFLLSVTFSTRDAQSGTASAMTKRIARLASLRSQCKWTERVVELLPFYARQGPFPSADIVRECSKAEEDGGETWHFVQLGFKSNGRADDDNRVPIGPILYCGAYDFATASQEPHYVTSYSTSILDDRLDQQYEDAAHLHHHRLVGAEPHLPH